MVRSIEIRYRYIIVLLFFQIKPVYEKLIKSLIPFSSWPMYLLSHIQTILT